MTDRSLPDDERIERLAAPLRAPVTLGDDFDDRVMREVRSLARHVPWWRRRYTLHVTPLGGLALAAGLALVAVLASRTTIPGRGVESRAVAAVAPRDTVYVVRFTLAHPAARHVALVGDFNGWSAEATPLAAAGADGVWSVSVPMAAGRHEYAFVVDGERWVSDPLAATVDDEFGTSSSVVHVGAAS